MNRDRKSTVKIRIATAVLLLAAAVSVCGCVPAASSASGGTPSVPCTVFPSAFEGIAGGKTIYLTSIGQSGDMLRLESSMKAAGSAYVADRLLDAGEVPSGSVVFIVAGCSIKGMAEGGLTVDGEMDRAVEFMKRTAAGEITAVAWHIGGAARRGYSSDKITEYVFSRSDLVLFTKDGNAAGDGGGYDLSRWAESGNVPYCQMEGYRDVAGVLILLSGEDRKK